MACLWVAAYGLQWGPVVTTTTAKTKKARFKCILDRMSNAFPTHLKRVAGKAFKSISDRIEMRLKCDCSNAFYKWDGQGHPPWPRGAAKERRKKKGVILSMSSHWRPSPLPRQCVERKYFKLFHLNYFHRTKAQKAKARRSGAQLKKHKGSKSDAHTMVSLI